MVLNSSEAGRGTGVSEDEALVPPFPDEGLSFYFLSGSPAHPILATTLESSRHNQPNPWQ